MTRSLNKEITRQRLLTQGVALLMQQGYHGTGVQEILDAVQVPKGSFYNYFASKEEFGAEVIAHYIEPFIEQLAMYLKQSDQGALAALEHYFDALIQDLQGKQFSGGCLLGNLMGEIGDTSETCRLALHQTVQRYRDLLRQALQQAQREGSVRQDKNAEELADLLLNSWQGALLRMKIERSVEPLRACCQHLLCGYFQPQQK